MKFCIKNGILPYAASVILIKEYGWARTDLIWKRNEKVFTMEEFMADSNLTEQALVKLQEDSSVELTKEESESICLDLIDHLLSDDKELADAVRTEIARVLPKVSKEVKDEIAHKLTIYDL